MNQANSTTASDEDGKHAQQSTVETPIEYDEDEAQLTLHRTWGQFESFASAFGALYFVGAVRILFSTGLYAGGPVAVWSSYVITVPLMMITATILAEVCSALPLSGSIYIWAAESAGKRWGRLVGFVVAFWSCTAWTSFVASNTQGTTNYMLSELTVFESAFPGDLDYSNVKFRAVAWACSEVFLLLAVLTNFLPPVAYKWIFRLTVWIIMLDFVMTMIWLPIGVARTYGFQNADWVFREYYNGTGAPDGWNWMLSFLFTSGIMTGFDASGHVSEETKHASIASARGMFWSCTTSGVLGFPVLILFLFCSPSLDVLFGYGSPQPFVILYDQALGSGGQVVMTVVAILGLFMNTSVAIVAASRLVYAVARDGLLPGSSWIGKVNSKGQPINAVIFIGVLASILLCTILPSQVAFTSLVSCGAVPTIAAYGLIPLCRLIFTPNSFKNARWSNGRFTTIFCVIAVIWNGFLVAVLLSPLEFPVDAQTFNFAPAVFGAITLFGIIAWWITPEELWLSKRAVAQLSDNAAKAPVEHATETVSSK